jgi:hypothetical protein
MNSIEYSSRSAVICETCGRVGRWIMADGTNRPNGVWCDACVERALLDDADHSSATNIDGIG